MNFFRRTDIQFEKLMSYSIDNELNIANDNLKVQLKKVITYLETFSEGHNHADG